MKKRLSSHLVALVCILISGVAMNQTSLAAGESGSVSATLTLTSAAVVQRGLAKKVKNNEPVADLFTGADADLIKDMVAARWVKAYPDDEVLQVRISDADWYRKQDGRWRDGRYEERDIGLVDAWVYVARKGDYVSQHSMLVEKDFRRGGAISISFGSRWYGELDPNNTVLRSKLDLDTE